VIESVSGAPVRNVTLRGITLTATEPTYMDTFMVSSGGDVSVQRSGAVYAQGTDALRVEGVRFDSIGG
jgi:hypothetical protein